jgi:hypothetical protein
MSSTEERRLLIVTGAAAADIEELPPLVRSLIESASEILVVTPYCRAGFSGSLRTRIA